MTPDQAVTLSKRYGVALLLIQRRSAAALAAIWAGLGSWDDAESPEWVTPASSVLVGAQAAAQAYTVGYYEALGVSGLAAAEVAHVDLKNPFFATWKALAAGSDIGLAVAAGAARMGSMATDEVMRAQGAVNNQVAGASGWRRIPNGPTCSYCVAASTQRYHSEDAARAVGHTNKGRLTCDCRVEPIIGDSDPGRVINSGLLEAWRKAQTQESPPAYFDGDTGQPAERPDSRPDTGQ